MNFPWKYQNHSPLTPRIEFTSSLGYFTDLYEFDATLQCSEEENHFLFNQSWRTQNCNQLKKVVYRID